jgi:hypothetical protein
MTQTILKQSPDGMHFRLLLADLRLSQIDPFLLSVARQPIPAVQRLR